MVQANPGNLLLISAAAIPVCWERGGYHSVGKCHALIKSSLNEFVGSKKGNSEIEWTLANPKSLGLQLVQARFLPE